MSDLEQFRDHARHMAGPFDGTTKSPPCSGRTFKNRDRETGQPQHRWCPGGLTCRCSCHEPTPADRRLWAQLADEIDRHLTRLDDTPLDFEDESDDCEHPNRSRRADRG